MSYDGWKDDSKYIERHEWFEQKLQRRNELYAIIKEKYPEVFELLKEYYKEDDW